MRKFGFVKKLKTQSIMVAPVKLLLAMLFGAILALIVVFIAGGIMMGAAIGVVFIVMVTRTIRRNRDDKKLR